MTDRTLVTGFLAFGGFRVNPSALLAKSCGRPFELLEVSYAAVDDFLDRVALAHGTFDRLLMLGLRGRGTAVELERAARNHVGAEPDVCGVTRGPAPIEPGAPDVLPTTLFHSAPEALLSFSDDPGCYLCNYVYYRALRGLPGKQVGFVHVPPEGVMPLDEQRRILHRLIEAIEARA